MHRLPFVAPVAALFFAIPAHALNWAMYAPATTACDDYPFPSCRGRSLCEDEGKYWYYGKCNQAKHPGQAALEKLDGQWDVTYQYISPCGGLVTFGVTQIILDKTLISDDNLQVAQFEGNIFSIASPHYYMPYGDVMSTDGAPYYRYAILGRSGYPYEFKDINISWGVGGGWCQLPDGTQIPGGLNIQIGDTGIYSFNLATPTTMKGAACFVDADVCLSFTGVRQDGYW